jgi:hypothetical protein
MGQLPEGRLVTEVTTTRDFPDWVAIQPRGWVAREALLVIQGGDDADKADGLTGTVVEATRGAPVVASSSVALPGLATHQATSRKRARSPQTDAAAVQPVRRREVSICLVGTGPSGDIYVLDALNILKYRNDESVPFNLNWSQLSRAADYYKKRGRRAYAFLRRTRNWCPQDWEVRQLARDFGNDFLVRCPPGADDDDFMITFASDFEGEGDATQPARVRIVTNDLFRDHIGRVDNAWVEEHTVKYTFAAGRFVPQAQEK